MTLSRARRGDPLIALALLLAGWIGARALTWEAIGVARPAVAALPGGARKSRPDQPLRAALAATPRILPLAVSRWAPVPAPVSRPVPAPLRLRPPAPASVPAVPRPGIAVGVAGAHPLLWAEALASLPVPPALIAARRLVVPPPFAVSAPEVGGGSRWSGDAWMLLRPGGGAGGPGPTYAASQAGAVLRYRLAPASVHRPAAYLRASAALNGSAERELAAGLAARPVPGLPVAVAAELRASARPGATRLRPAAFAVTEIAPLPLPGGLRAEAYAQAGYVGGDFATAFVDGQLRIDGRVARIGPAELRAGAGAWGGAQRGAARLDAGPGATLAMGAGPSARLALDWRFRIAGNAAPRSGPALTLSAGF